MYVKIINFV